MRISIRLLASLGLMAIVVVLVGLRLGLGTSGSFPSQARVVEAVSAATGDSLPQPTQLAGSMEEEENYRIERQLWIESLHRCPPGFDWRAAEEANRRAHSLARFSMLERGERTDYWNEVGSANQAGRTHAACPSTDRQWLYIGSDRGGVWRGTIDGTEYEPLSDGLGLGSFGLLVSPAGDGPDEPDVVVSIASQGGFGTIHASSDGGETWFVPEGLPENIYESIRLVHDGAEPWVVYFLSRSMQYVNGRTEYGYIISRSTDGGQTFEFRSVHSYTLRADIWIDRVSGGDLYMIHGTTFYVSHDGGITFEELGTLPAGSATDAILTGSEAGAPTFYAALEEGGQWKLYRSGNGGADWTWCYNINDFWETLLASITNENLVFFAGVECYRSTDGGYHFTKINNWWEYYNDPEHYLHADLPGMDSWIVNGQEAIYFNTDGGTFVSYDGGETVHNLSLWGLGISQYYSTFTSSNDPYLIAAGSQDQGYQVAIRSREPWLAFEQVISGDYGHLTSKDRNLDWVYSVYPGFVLLQRSESNPHVLYTIDFPSCNHSWMPPILADPTDEDVFYFCGDHLWRYERQGAGYTYEMTEMPQDFTEGGSSYASALAISPADYDYWYVATNSGYLWYSHDAGSTWTMSPDHGPSAHYFYGTALVASPEDPLVAHVGGSGYGGHCVYVTTDGGLSWEGMGEGLPQTLVYDLAIGGSSMDLLFAACEAGPYMYDPAVGQWESILGTEAPLTTYWSVEWVPELGVARFGTYGRGIWDFTPGGSQDAAEAHGQSRRQPLAILAIEPQPVRSSARVVLESIAATEATAAIFDISGRCVGSLGTRPLSVGRNEISVDLSGLNLASGFYVLKLETGTSSAAVALRLLR